MFHWLLQSTLCLILCPLVTAQQIAPPAASADVPQSSAPDLAFSSQSKSATITLHRGTIVPLVQLETISSATEQMGQKVQFAVSMDVKVDGVTVIPRGTQASGIVTFVCRAIRGKSNGMITIGPPSLSLPGGSSIQLRYVPYTDPEAAGISGVALFIAALPFVFSDMYKARHPAPERGDDEILPKCWKSWEVATTKKVRINLAVPNQNQSSNPTIDIDSICPTRGGPRSD
jgi:hypothetical protein